VVHAARVLVSPFERVDRGPNRVGNRDRSLRSVVEHDNDRPIVTPYHSCYDGLSRETALFPGNSAMPVAYSYVRFSSFRQKLGMSVQRQVENFNRACTQHGLTPAEEVFHDLSRSGWKKREQKTVQDKLDPVKSVQQRELKRFTELVTQGTIPAKSWIVFDEISRLGRIGNDGIRILLNFLVDNDITACINTDLVITRENINKFDIVMRVCILAEMAKMESDRKSEFIGHVWKSKLANASKDNLATAKAPLWLIPVFAELPSGKRKVVRFDLDEDKARVVRLIFSLSTVNGWGCRLIAVHLNKNNVPTFSGKGKWWDTHVRRIICDSRALGKFRDKTDYFPPIVDESTWLLANAAIKQRNRFKGRSERISNLFSHLSFDVTTGSPMILDSKSKKQVRWTSTAAYTTNTTEGKAFSYFVFENAFLQILTELNLKELVPQDKHLNDKISHFETSIANIDLQIAGIKQKLVSLGASPDKGMDILLDLDKKRETLSRLLNDVKAEKVQESPQASLDDCKTIICKLSKANGDELIELRSRLRQQIRQLVKRIEVRIEKKKSITDLYATVNYHSGHRRLIFLRTRLRKLVLSVHDVEKYLENPSPKAVEIHGDYAEKFSESDLRKAGFTFESFAGIKID